ncbi:hypothetical protein FA13DRAFT_1292733 [Coprinellus micaceus]|uniref:Uncharacterized protein n=1 Tax=Coprinellus micaceus TaxID=71717 RepID=A0A4Y7SS17_COPMI|nr:hypothetical protein FA13DRAFT_1292733 [Coprinellus micaceus]
MPTPLQQQRSGFSFEKSDAGGLRLDDDDSNPFCKARDFSYQNAFLSGTGLRYRSGDRQNLGTEPLRNAASTDVVRFSDSAFTRASNRARRSCGAVLVSCRYYVFHGPLEMFEHMLRCLSGGPKDDPDVGGEAAAVPTED